jgi:hypothetical protein
METKCPVCEKVCLDDSKCTCKHCSTIYCSVACRDEAWNESVALWPHRFFACNAVTIWAVVDSRNMWEADYLSSVVTFASTSKKRAKRWIRKHVDGFTSAWSIEPFQLALQDKKIQVEKLNKMTLWYKGSTTGFSASHSRIFYFFEAHALSTFFRSDPLKQVFSVRLHVPKLRTITGTIQQQKQAMV